MSTSENEASRFVSYAFVRLRKPPAFADSVSSSVQAQTQIRGLRLHQLFTKKVLIKGFVAVVIGRSGTFVTTKEFQAAVDLARENDCPLVVADIASLLKGARGAIWRCAQVLDRLDVTLFDARTMKAWHQMDPVTKGSLVVGAETLWLARSTSVKHGLRRCTPERKEVPARNRQLGSRALSMQADKRAEELRDFVQSCEDKLPPGQLITATALMRALNDAGKLSARGKRWTAPAARNLLTRLRATKPPTLP